MHATPPLFDSTEYRKSQFKAANIMGSCSLPQRFGRNTTFWPGLQAFSVADFSCEVTKHRLAGLMASWCELPPNFEHADVAKIIDMKRQSRCCLVPMVIFALPYKAIHNLESDKFVELTIPNIRGVKWPKQRIKIHSAWLIAPNVSYWGKVPEILYWLTTPATKIDNENKNTQR